MVRLKGLSLIPKFLTQRAGLGLTQKGKGRETKNGLIPFIYPLEEVYSIGLIP